MNNIKLYLGDCLEIMKEIPDGSVDLIIVDPPYGTTPYDWDIIIDFKSFINICKKVIKENGVIIIFGQEPFSSFMRTLYINDYKYDWYWEKERLTNVFQIKRRPGKVIENIMIFYNKSCNYFPQKIKHNGKKVTNKIGNSAKFSISMAGNTKIKPLEYNDDGFRYPKQILKFNRDNYRNVLHPTQKPVALIEYLIKTYTNENEVVLDNCMGSGTTGIACLNTNRKFIGIEKEEKYFEIAQKRILERYNEISLKQKERTSNSHLKKSEVKNGKRI